jgi:S-disulfanyl-L-cysteine oxidoreductase SoxD
MCMHNFLQTKKIKYTVNLLNAREGLWSQLYKNLFPRPLPFKGRVRVGMGHSGETNSNQQTQNQRYIFLLENKKIFLLLLAASQFSFAADNLTSPKLGQPTTETEIKTTNLSIYSNGQGLPKGSGNAQQGKLLYEKSCAACHGVKGIGASATELANGTHPLTSATPDKTIGTYWPYATTLFDFIRRSMPMTAPGSLTNDETYALTAYLLQINNVINEKQELNAQTLPKVLMPNAKGFIWIDTKSQDKK